MQKHGACELCGGIGLVADYGLNGEFICVKCGSAPEIIEHVDKEMIKRHGKEQVRTWVTNALSKIGGVRN